MIFLRRKDSTFPRLRKGQRCLKSWFIFRKRQLADEVKGTEVVKIREISRKQARREILEYLDKKERAWSSEIADTLRLDLTEVNRILEQLWGEKKVEPTT